METPKFEAEDLEIVELPEREAMGKLINNSFRQSGGGRGGNNILSDLVDIVGIIKL